MLACVDDVIKEGVLQVIKSIGRKLKGRNSLILDDSKAEVVEEQQGQEALLMPPEILLAQDSSSLLSSDTTNSPSPSSEVMSLFDDQPPIYINDVQVIDELII